MAEGADLVIGLGNPLRGDDGVGAWLAERARRLRPTPQVRTVQQLTPELADALAQTGRVLFIDAWWPPVPAPGGMARLPTLEPISVQSTQVGGGAFSHQLDPAQLLAITALLHDRAPQAWQLLVPAFAMPHGDTFSPRLLQELPRAEALLDGWCRSASQPAACHA